MLRYKATVSMPDTMRSFFGAITEVGAITGFSHSGDVIEIELDAEDLFELGITKMELLAHLHTYFYDVEIEVDKNNPAEIDKDNPDGEEADTPRES